MLRHHIFKLFSILFFLVSILPGWANNVKNAYESNFIDPLISPFLSPQAENNSLIQSFPSRIQSLAAILFEQETGTILFSKNSNLVIPPASLTKIMTIMLAFDYITENQIALNERVTIKADSYAINAPPRSSLMFLGPEQSPSWFDLLLGLSVSSGNDAAIAIAAACAGNTAAFVDKMNEKAKLLKLKETVFVEPSGYDSGNKTTIADFAYLLFYYLNKYPQSLSLLHSVPQFTYPNQFGIKGITQSNRNRLLKTYTGMDGIKTGYIDQSGYNFAFSAQRDGMRLTGIVLGASSEQDRFDDASKLLDWGFENFSMSVIHRPKLNAIRIWNGRQGSLVLESQMVRLMLPKHEWQLLNVAIEQLMEVRAPLSQNTRLGWFRLQLNKSFVRYNIPILLEKPLERANPIQVFGEDTYLFVRSLFGVQPPPSFN